MSQRTIRLLSTALSLVLTLSLLADEAKNTTATKIPEPQVLMRILHTKCTICHGKRRQAGGLDVRTRESLLKGGKSGPAFVPGKPDESLLLQMLRKEKSHFDQTPSRFDFVRLVSDDEIDEIRRWIAQGDPPQRDLSTAENAGSDPLVSNEDRQYWAFQPPVRYDAPRVKQQDRVRNPIDAFLLAKLEEAGLSFAPEADRRTLVRRAYFDLIGLPPEPDEVEAFVLDGAPNAYEAMIDRLLDSPHYGERWGKYWLDSVGYSDSDLQMQAGDRIRANAWRYRDYVIRSLNADLPYDQFLTEQLAGDELFDYKAAAAAGPLSNNQRERLIATGFLRTAIDVTNEFGYNLPARRLTVIYDQLQILGSATMGLTLECARCHSHKYDPIPQRDYYSLVSIFSTALDPYDWLVPSRGNEESVSSKWPDEVLRQLPYVAKEEKERVAVFNAPIEESIRKLESELKKNEEAHRLEIRKEKLAKLTDDVRITLEAALAQPEKKRTDAQKTLIAEVEPKIKVERSEIESRFPEFKSAAEDTAKKVKEKKKTLKAAPRIRAVFDMGGQRTRTYLYRRGDYRQVGEEVLPGVPAVLSDGLRPYSVEKPDWSTDTSGQRLGFARWLTQEKHPLTSRVMVNRMWMHHFGTGLAPTPGNLGKLGTRRTHPKLLDWLATEFVRLGWSMKAIHRLLMTSSAYRQSSVIAANTAAPEGGQLYSRFPLRRLDAEAIRDGILSVAKRLDTTPFGEPDEVEISAEGEVTTRPTSRGYRRSIYVHQLRANPLTMLDTFNGAKMNPNCVERPYSTVATQALQLSNSKFARENANYFARRVIKSVGNDLEAQIDLIFRTALGRPPSHDDLILAKKAILDLEKYWLGQIKGAILRTEIVAEASRKSLASLCHSILNSPDFIYID